MEIESTQRGYRHAIDEFVDWYSRHSEMPAER